LIWINVVGLGPFAGVLAIATSDLGSFGKLFSEAVEAADNRPVEPIIASGGTPIDAVRYGYLPQLFPVLYFFESNTRSSTIIGIVGAGGIGQQFSERIRALEWQHVAFLVLLVLVAVAVIDYLSAWLRAAMIGRRA
jgi:phosphonate transport system permease protein